MRFEMFNRRTFIVKIDKCVLDKIDELLSELRSEAPRGTKRQFDKLAKSILAKATAEATRKPKPDGDTIPSEQTPKDPEPTPSEETNVEKDDAGYEILPNGNVRLKEDLDSDDSDAKSGEGEEEEPYVDDAKSGEEEEEDYFDDGFGSGNGFGGGRNGNQNNRGFGGGGFKSNSGNQFFR